jgi:hypothetical protein
MLQRLTKLFFVEFQILYLLSFKSMFTFVLIYLFILFKEFLVLSFELLILTPSFNCSTLQYGLPNSQSHLKPYSHTPPAFLLSFSQTFVSLQPTFSQIYLFLINSKSLINLKFVLIGLLITNSTTHTAF